MVAAGAVVIMVVPALSTVTPGTARARRGRQAAISGITKAGADVALVLLAVVAGWQLRHYSAVSAGANGNFGVDPVIVIAPALALAGGTVLALRLLPVGGKAGDRLAARGRRLTAALASWQISRQPIRQGGAALLIVLAVATGTLALAQRQSWTRSDHDQAAFGSGADVRVETSQPLSAAQAAALVQLPGVRHAMPVATFAETATGGGDPRDRLGPGGERDAAPLRPVAAARGQPVRQDRSRPGQRGGHAARPPGELQLTARLGPASLGLAPATVSVSVEDADSDVYQLDAGTLPADGRPHTLTVTLANQAVPGGHGRRPNHRRPNHRRPNHRGHRGQRGFWGREGHLPAAADRDQPGLHAARRPSPGPGYLHRGQRVRRPGDGPDRRRGAARLARRRLVPRTGGRPADPRHERPLRPARGLGHG